MAQPQKPSTVVPPKPPPSPPLRVVAWALVRKGGGISPVRLEVDLFDGAVPEVVNLSVLPADFRAVAQAKVANELFDPLKTPTWR
jgi:hypothetical protein